MKSASEIRALMNDYGSRIPAIMSRLEGEIVAAARVGHEFKEVFIPTSNCSLDCAKNVRDRMLDLGYECKIEFIGDQRDGDCIKFFIKW